MSGVRLFNSRKDPWVLGIYPGHPVAPPVEEVTTEKNQLAQIALVPEAELDEEAPRSIVVRQLTGLGVI